MSEKARGGKRAGAGRKPKSKTGEIMKTRAMRWTDSGWAEVMLIGIDRVRAIVAKDAAKVRRMKSGPTVEANEGEETWKQPTLHCEIE